MKWNLQYQLIRNVAILVFLASCDSGSSPSTASLESSQLSLTAPAKLTRAVDSEALFAEVNLTYFFATETISRTETASRSGNSNTWNIALDVPANTEFTLEVTWYDMLDPRRVDLTRLTRTVNAGATDSRIRLVFDFADYDFSGFDLDEDTIPNLVERENGTSPFQPPEDDPDTDSDGIVDSLPDNCVLIANPDQANFDNDALGDACDEDDDNDGTNDTLDCSPLDAAINPNAVEILDGIDNNCSGQIDDIEEVEVLDADADGAPDATDNCPVIANADQLNSDSDAQGDACDEDDDNDGTSDNLDCSPLDAAINPNAVEIQDGLDNNCNDQVDETTPVGLLSSASVDETDGVFFPGTPPEAIGTIVLSPLDDGSLTTIIAGGSIEIPVLADKPFSRIYVASDTTGYFDIQLPQSVNEAILVATSSPDMSNIAEAEIGVKVESAEGEVSTSQFLPVAPLDVGTGEFQVSISWDQPTDLDLYLTTPSGDRIYYFNPIVGNGMLDLDSNPNCVIDGINNENITFSDGQPPAGQYSVAVDYFDNCNIVTPTNFIVTVRANGRVQTFSGQLFPADVESFEPRLITTIEIR